MSTKRCNGCGCCGSRLTNTSSTFNGVDGWGAVPAKATFDNYNNHTKIAGFYNFAKVNSYFKINGVIYQGNKPVYINGVYVMPYKYPGAVMVSCYACLCCPS